MKIDKNWITPLMSCMETVFLVDDDNKKIVFSNDSPAGCFCYEAFFGRTDVCPFCPKLNENELYTWDYYDKTNNRWLKIKNFLFHDGDRLLRAGNFNRMDDAMNLSHDSVQEISFLQKLLSENQRIKDALEREATHDSMTGLLNRNRFNMDIASGIYDYQNTGVMYFDLNNLKEVNDTFRHEAGDRLICRLAEVIRLVSEDMPGSQCYRVGGDEFVLVVPDSSQALLDSAENSFHEIISKYERENPPCIAAVGIAFSAQPQDAEALVSKADKAMYQDKIRLKNIKP